MPRAWRTSRSVGRSGPAGAPAPATPAREGAPAPLTREGVPATLTPARLRDLARRHGIVPRKALGQHFLIEPSLARAIVRQSGVGAGSRVLEIGAGLGSLTMALAESGAEVLAVERDPRLLPALHEVLAGMSRVRVVAADALEADWGPMLGPGSWTVVANLPYNVAVPVLMRILEHEPRVERLVVMIQREVGERLVATPGQPPYGAVSVRVAYLAEPKLIRRVPPSVFWPRPVIESVVVRLDRRSSPPVPVDKDSLWRVIEIAFAQRRKTMRGAMIRLGMDAQAAEGALSRCGVEPDRRPEELGLESFACLAEQWRAARDVS